MHNAPAVTYPVGRSFFQAWFSSAIGLLALGVCGFWFWQVPNWGWRQGLVSALLLLAGITAARAWYTTALAVLRWDGQSWWREVENTAREVRLTVHLDFQTSILLCLQSDAGSRHWVWLECRSEPAAWMGLRRAVFASTGKRKSQDNVVYF